MRELLTECLICGQPAQFDKSVLFESNEWEAAGRVHAFHAKVNLSDVREALSEKAGERREPNWFDRTYRFHRDGEENRAVEFLCQHVPKGHQVRVLVGQTGFLEITCEDCDLTYDTAIEPGGDPAAGVRSSG